MMIDDIESSNIFNIETLTYSSCKGETNKYIYIYINVCNVHCAYIN